MINSEPLFSRLESRLIWPVFAVAISLFCWIYFGDLANHLLDSHDSETFQDNIDISRDFSRFFAADKAQPSGRPVAEMTKWLFSMAWGNNPAAFHLFVVALHGIASFLLASLFRHLTSDTVLGLTTGLLFLVHVGHYEAIHHISAIDYPLALVWGCAALRCYVCYSETARTLRLLLFYLCFTLSILSHIGIGILWLFCIYWSWQHGLNLKSSLRTHLPFVLFGILLTIALINITSRATNLWRAIEAITNYTTIDAITNWAQITLLLLSRLLTTAHWLPIPVYQVQRWEIVVGGVLLVGLLVLIRRGDSIGTMGSVWIILTLLPFTLVDKPGLVSYLPSGPSRYIYMASAGSSLLLAKLMLYTSSRLEAWCRPIFACFISGILVSSYLYRDNAEAISRYTSSRNYALQGNFRTSIQELRLAMSLEGDAIDRKEAYHSLCLRTMALGEDSTPLILEALRAYPRDPPLLAYRLAVDSIDSKINPKTLGSEPRARARAYHYIGLGQYEQGNLAGSANAFRLALHFDAQRENTRKRLVAVLANLGTALRSGGDIQGAENAYLEAVQLQPDHPTLYHNLGGLALETEDRQRATEYFQQAIRLGSTDAKGHWALARLYYDVGKQKQALEICAHLLDDNLQETDPDFYFDMGMSLYNWGYIDEAEKAYRRTLALDAFHIAAHNNLGWICYSTKRLNQAITHYRFVLEKSSHSVAQFNLGLAYLASGDSATAQAAYAQGALQFEVGTGERIAALQDLEDFLEQGIQVQAARRIMAILRP